MDLAHVALSAKLTGTDHSDILRHTNNILAYSILALYSFSAIRLNSYLVRLLYLYGIFLFYTYMLGYFEYVFNIWCFNCED